MQLYSSYLSTPSFTIRIALKLKGLDYEHKSVNLFKKEKFSQEFLNINPMGYVPAIVDGDIVLADSFAILLYLEETYPQHPLIPCDIAKRIVNYQGLIMNTNLSTSSKESSSARYLEETYPQHPLIPCDIAKRIVNYQSEFPLLCRLGEAYIKVPAIENAIPEKQPDFPIN
nr:glutathione S-transferase zeta class-like [Tanacetum cinerariifolium]